MIEGIYSGASALQALEKQQELISNNLMHVNTSGHRKNVAGVQQRFELDPDVSVDLGPEIDQVARDFSPGRMVQTGRPLDISISGDGFFMFNGPDGEYLSRDGRLFRDPDSGNLINSAGVPIMGESGPINIDTDFGDREIVVASDGTLSVDGQEIDKIATVAFQDNSTLVPDGDVRFRRGQGTVESETQVRVAQFQHELSNVQPVTELIALIVNNRQYEAVQKATRTLSESLGEYIRS